jgi:uncharacterized membrane protein
MPARPPPLFPAPLVEFVEALAVVLAAGAVHEWRDALSGSVLAPFLLAIGIAVLVAENVARTASTHISGT